jgi:hypothetical protein
MTAAGTPVAPGFTLAAGVGLGLIGCAGEQLDAGAAAGEEAAAKGIEQQLIRWTVGSGGVGGVSG